MRTIALLSFCSLVSLAAGCAAQRLTVATPQTPPAAAASEANQRAVARAVALMRVHGEDLAACFDQLQARHASGPAALRYDMDLELRDRSILLLGLSPRDKATAADRQLEDCITEILIPWQGEPTPGMRLVVPVAVKARPQAPRSFAQSTTNRYVPPERSDE